MPRDTLAIGLLLAIFVLVLLIFFGVHAPAHT